MQRKKYSLILFYLLLIIQRNYCSGITQTAWKPKSISDSILNDPLYQNVEKATDSDIKCALMANNLKWSNVMYFDNGICHLATVDLTSCMTVSVLGPNAIEANWLHKGI